MVFSSATFLFIFLPLVFVLHTATKNINLRNALLILASLIFYSFGEPVFVLLLLLSVFLNYLFAKLIATRNNRKMFLILAVIYNLSMLVVFKYAGFLAELLNAIPFIKLPKVNIHMPIGISFYTFQALSYVIDTYRDEERRYGRYHEVLLYISLFPQLVAGPIVKYYSVKDQINERTVTIEGVYAGVTGFICGLGKKMLIANYMAVAADKMFALSVNELDTFSAWVGAVCYMLQIYFDFSGYSDMAVGMGKILGFTFPENFNYPYIAASIRDFWKRWHISLTSWFREYLYFPLGGNRKGSLRTIINRFFVFVCTGIWHGANLTFLFWGIYHGILTCIETVAERVGVKRSKEKNIEEIKKQNTAVTVIKSMAGHLYTLLAVMIGFVIFRADNMAQAGHFIVMLFSFESVFAGTMAAMSVMSPLFIAVLVIAIAASTPVFRIKKESTCIGMAKIFFCIVVYALCILEIAAGSYNPFIYFRF